MVLAALKVQEKRLAEVREEVNQSVQAETDKLLVERKLTINKATEDLEAGLAEARDTLNTLTVLGDTKKLDIDAAKNELVAIESLIEEKSAALGALKVEEVVQRDRVERLTNEESDLKKSVSELAEKMSQQKSDALALKTEVDDLGKAKLELETAIDLARTDSDRGLEEAKRNLNNAQGKRDALALEIQSMSHNMDIQQKELASRTLALDARDKNIRVREARLIAGEARITANANLLDL